jgi:hypothetical protein
MYLEYIDIRAQHDSMEPKRGSGLQPEYPIGRSGRIPRSGTGFASYMRPSMWEGLPRPDFPS